VLLLAVVLAGCKSNPKQIQTRNTTPAKFSYAGTAVLSGKLVSRMYYGPPGYGDDPQTDAKENQLILILNTPIDVSGGSPDPNDIPAANVSEVTLVPAKGAKLTAYREKNVTVSGHLFGEFTAHHHTPVLLGEVKLKMDNGN
jgi:hypothetical protein